MAIVRSLVSLTIFFCTFIDTGSSCNGTCPVEDGWDSMIAVGDQGARFVHITWTEDTQSTLYVVRYRQANTQIYSSSLEISTTDYNITQLLPETDYEVQVCRATLTSSPDDCGNCLLCISTVDQLQVPGAVTNIRAYVYKPTRGSDDLTALVLWDEPQSVVSNYTVSMFQDGQMLFPPAEIPSLYAPAMLLYQPSSTDNHYIVSARTFDNTVKYFLTPGTSYVLQITANNPSGMGAPSQVYINVTEPDYPQNYLIIKDTGVHLAGVDAEFNHALPATARPPVAVDTINRLVYWYHESPRSIARHSLKSGRMDIHPYLLLPDGTDLLAMAFEWVGMDLYYMLRDQHNNLVRIMKVSTVNINSLTQVGPILHEKVPPEAKIKTVVDPFGGYLHWLVVNSVNASLHRIDLRNASLSTEVNFRSHTGQATGLESLTLSSALVLDPLTGNLLLSDAISGDIVNCSVVDDTCATLISADSWQSQLGCNDTGYPARSLALNEQRLYWIGGMSSCVLAVELDNPITLLVVSNESASEILTLSPGQQVLPTQDCLAPNVLRVYDRPRPQPFMLRNTSVILKWMPLNLEEHCEDVVVSFPPVIYGITVKYFERPIPGFPIYTFETEYFIDGLLPFTGYDAKLSVSNMYTIRGNYIDRLFSSDLHFTTREGVPDPPTGLSFLVFGTADVQISWTLQLPQPWIVRGADQLFYVKLFNNGTLRGEVQVDEPPAFLNASDGIMSGCTQDIVVIVSNGVLNSTGALIQVTPWPLIPQPLIVNKTNTTIAVKIILDDNQIYEPVTNVNIKICRSDSTDRCDCSQAAITDQADFKSVENSTEWMFVFQNLQAQVQYCVQSIGIYRVIEDFTAEPEVTSGESVLVQTDDGVPDPPVIQLRPGMENILEWNTPLSRGPAILFYTIEAMLIDTPISSPVRFDIEETETDLSRRTELTSGSVYSIRAFATNAIGESNSSNAIEYTKPQGLVIIGDVDTTTLVSALSIGSILFLVAIALCVVAFFICSHWAKKKSPLHANDVHNLRDAESEAGAWKTEELRESVKV